MCKFNFKHGDKRIDPCMRVLVNFINNETNYKTIMCCCGHNKYSPSLIIVNLRVPGILQRPYEIFSGIYFKHNQKRFYKTDKDGYYYIPELVGYKK